MSARARVRHFALLALLVGSCRGGTGSPHKTGGGGEDSGGAQPAQSWKLDDVTDPYVAWLAGRGARPDWPPKPIPGMLETAGVKVNAAVEPPWPNLLWDGTGLSVTWDATVPRAGAACSEITPALNAYLEKNGFGPPPAGARRDKRLFYTAANGVERLISHSCSDAEEQNNPGCTGGNCWRPPTLSIQYAVGLRSSGAISLDGALAPFATVDQALRASLLPAFLAEVVGAARLQSIYCERWTGATCEWDLRFEVVPPGDARQWILETIEVAKRYGFACDQTWRDPEREEIGSTQACSGKNLWYHLERGRVRIRLATIVGAEPRGTPVECSADYFAEQGSKPPPPPDPSVQTILDVPVRGTAVGHMDRVRDCYLEHQESAGRAVEMGDWRRLGDYLQRSGHDRETGQEVTVGVEHRPYALPTANGFFMRVKRRARDSLSIEMYVRQEDFDKAIGGGYIELRELHDVPLFRVTLPWPDASAPAVGEQAFIDAALAAVEDAHQRALRGIGRRQECKVLPNMGQECDWVETTPAEQAEAKKSLEASRDKLLARVRADRAEIYGLVTDLYPWSSDECSLLRKP